MKELENDQSEFSEKKDLNLSTPLITENQKKEKDKKEKLKNALDNFFKESPEVKEVEKSRRRSCGSRKISLILTLQSRKMSAIKSFIEMNRAKKKWENIRSTIRYQYEDNKSLKKILKKIFNINSDFVIIWKFIFSLFNVIVIDLYFFHYFFVKLWKFDGNYETNPRRIYHLINYMLITEFIISVLIVIFNKGSKATYIKLPFKLLMCIPVHFSFYLGDNPKIVNILILIKFARLDLIDRCFVTIEKFLKRVINKFLNNYLIMVILSYTIHIFKYLFTFFIYGHFLSCLYTFFYDTKETKYDSYWQNIHFTLETFTTIGFGSIDPMDGNKQKNYEKFRFIIAIINMFTGINLFYIIFSNIKFLFVRVYKFNRRSSFDDEFNSFIYNIQKSTNRIVPRNLYESMNSYSLFRKGLSYNDIIGKYDSILAMCRPGVKNDIRDKLFSYLVSEYKDFFKDTSLDFMYRIFENLRPKV